MTETVLKGLFPTYPRAVGNPLQSTVNSFEELLEFVKNNNGKKRAFCALYDKTRLLDKIWVDIDTNPFQNCIKLHAYLQSHEYKHLIIFSGKGFHFYILTDKQPCNNSKMALLNCHNWLEEEAKIIIDKQVKGDIARIVTVPTTFNSKRNSYAIFVSQKMLDAGYENIAQLAKTNCFGELEFFGEKKLSMALFDCEWDKTYEEIGKDLQIDQALVEKSKILQAVPPCMQEMVTAMQNNSSSYKERFFVINYMFQKGFNKEQIAFFMKNVLSEKKYLHMMNEEKQIDDIEKNKFKYFVNCKTVKDFGYCSDCGQVI